jgi:hypothetical protein
MGIPAIAQDFFERAAWTAGQQFLAVLLAIDPKSGFINLPWEIALATAAGAAVVSLFTTALLYLPVLRAQVGKNFLADLVLRLVKTFISSFLGTVGAMQFNVLTFDWSNALDLAAVTTIAALAKGFLAAGPGDSHNPSTLPAAQYTSIYR